MPAIALALMAAKQQLPLDFEHSRLTPAAPKRFGRRALIGGTIGIVAAILVVIMLVLSSHRQSKLDALKTQLNNPELLAAKAAIDRLNFGRGFFPEGRSSAIDCLRELSLAFRADEKIWTTSFTFREGGKCNLTGKANDQKTILRVLEGLKQTGKFTDVKLLDMREADAKGTESTFSIGFTYNGAS
jgi:Tfp pilus assembly protein PilN